MPHNDSLKNLLNRYFPGRYKFEEVGRTLMAEDTRHFPVSINEEAQVRADSVIVEHILDENFFNRIVNGSEEDQKTVLEAASYMEKGEKIQVIDLFVQHYHKNRKLSVLNRIVPFKSFSLQNKIIYINLLYDAYYRNRNKFEGNRLRTEDIKDFTNREEVRGLWKDLITDIKSSLNKPNMALVGELNPSRAGYNLLMLTAACYPEEIETVINFIKNHPAQLEQLLTHRYDFGTNALIMAAYYNSTAVHSLLEATHSLSSETRLSVLSDMLTAKTSTGFNALMHVARYNPNQVPNLLEAANSLHHDTKSNVLSDMLTAKTSTGFNALMIAALYNPKQVPALLEATNSLNPDTKSSVLTEMLKAKTSEGENALMLANMRANKLTDGDPQKQLYHDAQKRLIDEIRSLPTADRLDIIASMRLANRPSVTQHLIQQLEENQPITNTPAKPG